MYRPALICSISLCLIVAFALVPLPAPAATVPPLRPDVVQDEAGKLTAADRQFITNTLAAYSPEKYKILLVNVATVGDIDAFLDQVWSEWKLPPESILLLLALGDGNRIRFFLGSRVSAWGVTPERVVEGIRGVYTTEMAAGHIASAITGLAQAIHRQVPQGNAAPTAKEPAPGRNGNSEPSSWWSRLQMPRWSDDFQAPDWAPYPLGAAGVLLMAASVFTYRRQASRWREEVRERLSQSRS